jgi:hypothetical protein
MSDYAAPLSNRLRLVRRMVPSLRTGAPARRKEPAHPSGTHPHRYIDEMTREEVLSELVAEHNATVSPGARRLSDGDLRMLLEFLRWRWWTRRHGRPQSDVWRPPHERPD